MCSFVGKHLFVCQVNIFYDLGGKIPYFIKKSHKRGFDSPINPMAYLEMLSHLKFY